ncbi:MAG TPA: RDD family protein [Burkholderiales bacterium]|jgi:uncharacterized RDD family membrane protein YckC|nr:RDD family protein [Burkholderiales bacterium]
MNYGGFWIRFLAYLVDSLIVTVGFVGIMLLLGAMGLELAGAEIIFLVLSILYWALMQSSPRQATLGKELCGLKVGGPNGERMSLPRALGREAAKIISSLTLLIGFIIAAFTRNKQALHDFVASTYVVRASEGKVVAALGLALLALCAPVLAGMYMGTAFIDGFTASVTASVLGEQPAPKQAQAASKPAAPAPAPTPKVVAEAPKPAAEAPKQVAAAPAAPAQAVPVAMPVQQAAKAPEAPKPAPAPAKAVAQPAAAPEPVKVATPVAPKEEQPAKAEPVAQERAPAKEASLIPVRMAAGPVYESKLRFNDLVTAVLYQDAGTVNDLLAFGKWPDKADSTGMTPLMIAVSLGQAEIAQALLKAGADPQRVGPGGVTAISIARERKDAALLGLLQRKR